MHGSGSGYEVSAVAAGWSRHGGAAVCQAGCSVENAISDGSGAPGGRRTQTCQLCHTCMLKIVGKAAPAAADRQSQQQPATMQLRMLQVVEGGEGQGATWPHKARGARGQGQEAGTTCRLHG
jgi:hypothetical protein